MKPDSVNYYPHFAYKQFSYGDIKPWDTKSKKVGRILKTYSWVDFYKKLYISAFKD